MYAPVCFCKPAARRKRTQNDPDTAEPADLILRATLAACSEVSHRSSPAPVFGESGASADWDRPTTAYLPNIPPTRREGDHLKTFNAPKNPTARWILPIASTLVLGMAVTAALAQSAPADQDFFLRPPSVPANIRVLP